MVAYNIILICEGVRVMKIIIMKGWIRKFIISFIISIVAAAFLGFISTRTAYAASIEEQMTNHMLYISASQDEKVYKDGMFCYIITNEANKEVRLVGIEYNNETKELTIPGNVAIDGIQYTVSLMCITYDYCCNTDYSAFYNSVEKLIFDDTFTGIVYNPSYAFSGLKTMEFTGSIVPEIIYDELTNGSAILDILFIVPEGMKEAYQKSIHESMYYYNGSDLYEKYIELTPTIITANEIAKVEQECFRSGGFIYQVVSSGKNVIGTVQLLGIDYYEKPFWKQRVLDNSYLALPEEVINNGYSYQLTKLCDSSLVRCGAKAIVIPDTVTRMDSYVFDKYVELMFLSKNCKVIPSGMIIDENNETNLRFVSAPEGITTISKNAFNNYTQNKASIILPTTITSLGKKALYDFRLVTFLRKKTIKNIASAVNTRTTVKVNESSISSYKPLFNSKVSVIAAKNIIKSTKLTVNASDVTITTNAKKTLKGTLSKGSNETVYWLSSNTDLFTISSSGVITAKKAGTAYAIAYTRTSGLHQAVKITVHDR